ncbi:hypothetical protein NEOLEDRAFT_920195 [Neolentinus lepideus HHB14362 ss-1]|uniref:Uncharacterized protein n=1 Tax=Neolentinus lepideus HHB14362 ss-1 TaxID=1314782 RepID=A0A165UMM5_9AGAM|nr:hypothetical protein NEOLEDRAFT_920195 [Neolentinus lepideus HHB14362 ss-1]
MLDSRFVGFILIALSAIAMATPTTTTSTLPCCSCILPSQGDLRVRAEDIQCKKCACG